MNLDGPFVSVAALCESVLYEKEGQISCIRLIDALNVQIASEDPNSSVRLKLSALVSFKSGPFVGTKTCTLGLLNPSGKRGKLSGENPPEFAMKFNGQEHSYSLILAFDLPANQSGVYILDVMLDGELSARIPFRINITRLPKQKQPENSQQTLDHPA
jgi:hypothetical protein